MSKCNSEKGVFFALTAILSAVIIGAIFFLGINTFIVRRASLELRRSADSICRQLIQTPPALSYDTVLHFQKLINEHSDFYPADAIKLTEARLILPTMPLDYFTLYDGNFTDYEAYLIDNKTPSNNYFQNWLGEKFSKLDPDLKCQNNLITEGSDFDCELQTHLKWTDENQRKYPEHIWNNYDNAGNTIGCELKGNVKIFGLKLPIFQSLDSIHKISARTAVWSKIRGDYSGYLPKSRQITGLQAEAPGLTIAISTHLQTDANKSRFRFPRLETKYNWFNNATYDPLFDYISGGPMLIPGFNGTSSARIYSDGSTSATVATFRNFSNSDQQAQMLAACMNPLVLARNLFLQTITELASRNGQLRNSTEILHIGTQSRNVSDTNTLPIVRSQPTLITEFGQDLTLRVFQLPYISFDSGNSATPADFVGLTPNGPLDIFASSELAKDHATIAAQLRNCFHLYKTPTSGNSIAIKRIKENINNYIFEDPAVYDFPDSFVNSGYTDWDQMDPWGSSTNTTKFNAASILSVLGATQTCPYPFIQSDGNTCLKPGLPSNDLRPDLLGLLKYLHEGADSISALRSPGIYPPTLNLEKNAINKKTPIIITTHQPITENEANQITEYFNIDPNFWAQRHITIVFFSSSSSDSVENLCSAFNCGEDYNQNNLIVFSPYTERNNLVYKDANEDVNFRDYWMDLINPDSPEYIVYKAISVYKSKTFDEWKF